jgi:hypothetical protein
MPHLVKRAGSAIGHERYNRKHFFACINSITLGNCRSGHFNSIDVGAYPLQGKDRQTFNSRALLADAARSKTCLYLSVILLVASVGYELTGSACRILLEPSASPSSPSGKGVRRLIKRRASHAVAGANVQALRNECNLFFFH